jgi:threonine dehydratase
MPRSGRSTTTGRTKAPILSFRRGVKGPVPTVELKAVHEAQSRLRPYVRRTPIMQAWLPSVPSVATVPLHLKLENLQIAGGADVRGVLNFALSLPPETLARGLVTATWGNVGSAVAYVGQLLGIKTTVYMVRPFASAEMRAAIERWGAEVIVQGTTWDATERIASEYAAERGIAYIHPFADPTVIAGDATVALDVIETIPDLATLVVPASAGGGLISGVALAAKETNPALRVVGVEVDRVARFYHSLQAGRPMDVPQPARKLGPRAPEPINFDLVRRYVDEIVLVTDQEIMETLQVLWQELEVSASRFGVTPVAAVLLNRIDLPANGSLCAIVGASGEEGLF